MAHPKIKNRTRRRLGFVLMVLAAGLAALNLERSANMVITVLPVVFLIAGAVLLRNSRSSAEDAALRTSHRSRRSGSDSTAR